MATIKVHAGDVLRVRVSFTLKHAPVLFLVPLTVVSFTSAFGQTNPNGPTPAMTNLTIQAMVNGGVPVPTIIRAIKTAPKIDLYTNDREYAQIVAAGASTSDANQIMRAIHQREYDGAEKWSADPIVSTAISTSVASVVKPQISTIPPAPAIIDPQPQPPVIRAAREPIAPPRIIVQLSPEELAALCFRATKIIGDPMQEFAAQEEAHTVALLYKCAQSSSTIDPSRQADGAHVETEARAQSEPSYVAPSYTAGPAPSYTAAAPVPTCGRWCIFFQGLAQAIQDQQNGAYVYAGRPVAASRKPAAKKTKK
jgi:hypothetical protein